MSGTLKRAAELFVIDEWGSHSDFVHKAWTSRSEPEPAFISVATSQWSMCVTTQRGRANVTVRGPETRATVTAIPSDAEFFGIVFSLGAYMPALPPSRLVDRALTLPPASRESVWIDGARAEIPTRATADVFVDRLVRDGLLVRDPLVEETLQSGPDTRSRRTQQRRVARATGLTRYTIEQIDRAERAVRTLERGSTPSDTANLLGFADQAHLTRSLKRFVGQTPAQVANAARGA